jgi:hypothetical protein
MRPVLFAVACLLMGCNTNKVAQLERENSALKAQLAAANLDLQAKCAKDAKTYFRENWSEDANTRLLTFSNHYSQHLNSCFITVQYNYDNSTGGARTVSVSNVYEGFNILATFEEYPNHKATPDSSATYSIVCRIGERTCKDTKEFWDGIKSYTEN